MTDRPHPGAAALRSGAAAALAAGGVVLLAAAGALAADRALGIAYTVRALLLYACAAAVILATIEHHRPHLRFGPANAVTLGRVVLACLLAGMVGAGPADADCLWLAAGIGAAAAVLDGVDGRTARRTGMASRFGARFDMEVDALTILVLALLAWQWGRVGAWVIAIGALRYGFVAAALVVPRLADPLPPSLRRKTVAVVQGVALILCLAPVLPASAPAPIAAAALALLVWSFAVDIAWLLRPLPGAMADRPAAALGLARSLLVYHGIPGRARRKRRFYAAFVRSGDLCFDIGAHVGDRTRCWRSLGARVVAVEPQPGLARWLARWFRNDPGVEVVGAAVGAAAGQAMLLTSPRHPTLATLSPAWAAEIGGADSFAEIAWSGRETVAVTTLDALIARHGRPAFCKIDVEGHEAEVLEGLSQPLPALSVEYVPAAIGVAVAALARLEALGDYRYNLVPGESARLLWDDWRDADAVVAWLQARRPDELSGDIYARLAPGEPAGG